ncbi:hypothetical protein DEU56DRAFT_939976 [Suillus clintonianus]|uniref:uncharacterized protein n=1 Tax=Suillus clintonianus TaxID=1904413 RepID=UPI001B874312|nr:uncharacterized protein DEU56DRAFT_939976 [Suillus clintonianus]KAG2142462.1 hypothetical protein DEU56DRAFT_939976 [Suillus clintonianus]
MLENDQLYSAKETDMAFPSFGKYMLDKDGLCDLTETDMGVLAGAVFAAGSDTEQAEVQAELDAVIGRYRGNSIQSYISTKTPTFDDQQSLPRLKAFLLVVVVVKTVVFHLGPQYSAAPGLTITASQLGPSRDPEVYPEPCASKPQHWINEQGGLRDDFIFVLGLVGLFQHFSRSTRCEPVKPSYHAHDILSSSRLVQIGGHKLSPYSLGFQLTLDPTKPLDDMGLMKVSMPDG